MCSAADLQQKISAYYDPAESDPHHRYRSWEHCYRFFQSRSREAIAAEKDAAALQLGFYLASWGMYRGSTFLLQRAYTVHEEVVLRLASAEFSDLWGKDIDAGFADARLAERILAAVRAVKDAYAPFGRATDTLATKVILGTVGCVPACDRFFIDGFKRSGRPYSSLNARFVARILRFCADCGPELRVAQARIEATSRLKYPLMKLADMYFWQIGYEAEARRLGGPPNVSEELRDIVSASAER